MMLLLLWLTLNMSIGAIIDTIWMQSAVRMGEDGWCIRYGRERTPHVVLELRVH